MSNLYTNALEHHEDLYSAYLSTSGVCAGLSVEKDAMVIEPARDLNYPVDFVLDDRKVHALLG
ncbi:hypothetical protein [Stenotrophomonas geniculata]|uniref:hypothetical protein n=1 Tax=Stenotrophomonas geniculata TaxID=86188 RepID=UPI0032E47EE3